MTDNTQYTDINRGNNDVTPEGVLAEQFKAGVQALMETQPSEEELDEYIGRFGALAQQPLVVH